MVYSKKETPKLPFLSFLGLAASIEPGHNQDKEFHRMSIYELTNLVGLASVVRGLNSDEARKLLKSNGPNKLPASESLLFSSILRSFLKGFGPLLWMAAIISFILYEPLGGPKPVRLIL